MFRFLAIFILLTGTVLAQIPQTLGWYEVPNTKLHPLAPPANFGGTTYDFPFYFTNHIGGWNSGVFDTTRNRLITFGGGHNDYYGNEIYAISLNTLTATRLTNPGIPLPDATCPESLVGGTQPNSRHTYDGIVYMPNLDKMFVYGGAKCTCGFLSRGTWMFNFATNTWEPKSPSGTIPVDDPGVVTAYDPNLGIVWLHDNHGLYSYDPVANSYTRRNAQGIDYHETAAIDPIRKRFVIVGSGAVKWYDINPATADWVIHTLATTGGDPIVNSAYPGMEYDTASQHMVAWNGGNTVYSLNLDTGVWTPITYTGGPGAPQSTGTYGHWNYSPATGVFVIVNSVDNNMFTLRLEGGTADTTPPSAPTNVTATAVSTSQINLTWTASTDNVGVVGYNIYHCSGASCTPSTLIGSSTSTSFSDTTLTAGTVYRFSIEAYDSTLNISPRSAIASATTSGTPPPPGTIFGYPMTTLQNEKDTYTRWGWTWNVNLEPNYPTAGSYTINDPDIHGDTEADDLWNYLVQYTRTNQGGFLTRMNAWANYYKTGYQPCVGTGARTYCSDSNNYGLDHLWGWGLIALYENSGNTDTIALGQAQAIASNLETLWAPGSSFGCLDSGGCLWYGLRQAARHLLFITRLTERDSNPRWITLRTKIINTFINSVQWDAARGMYWMGEYMTDTNPALGTGAWAAGARIQSPFQLGYLMEAFFHAYRVTGNTILRDRMVAIAQFVKQYGLDPNYQYTGSDFGIVNGVVWHNYFASCGSTCTFTDPSMTTDLVNTLVLGYKFSGDTTLLDRAKVHFNRGTKAFYGSINRLAGDTVVHHFMDTVFDNSTSNIYFAYNKGELQYTYLIFENGGLPTVVSLAVPNAPSNLRVIP